MLVVGQIDFLKVRVSELRVLLSNREDIVSACAQLAVICILGLLPTLILGLVDDLELGTRCLFLLCCIHPDSAL